MKFRRNAAALLTVFHPETTHTGSYSTPKDVKNEGRSGKVYENKAARDTMSESISGICARLKPFLQKIGVCSSQNTSKAPPTYRTAGGAESLLLRLCGFSQTRAFPPANANSRIQVLQPCVWIGGPLWMRPLQRTQ